MFWTDCCSPQCGGFHAQTLADGPATSAEYHSPAVQRRIVKLVEGRALLAARVKLIARHFRKVSKAGGSVFDKPTRGSSLYYSWMLGLLLLSRPPRRRRAGSSGPPSAGHVNYHINICWPATTDRFARTLIETVFTLFRVWSSLHRIVSFRAHAPLFGVVLRLASHAALACNMCNTRCPQHNAALCSMGLEAIVFH